MNTETSLIYRAPPINASVNPHPITDRPINLPAKLAKAELSILFNLMKSNVSVKYDTIKIPIKRKNQQTW
ncbi:MAG: hypothetical protein R2771_15280 [Saprospiraceae bacterium]